MPDQVPRNLEIITVLGFEDGDNHYLQSWKGQLNFREGEIINLRGIWELVIVDQENT